MLPRREEPRLFVAGVLLAVSWIGTLYLYRQNQILRQQRTSNLDNDPVDSSDPDKDRKQDESEKFFVMDELGVIQSPFPQRAGCPRQGTLAPHVTSRLILHPHISIQVLEGMKAYSHVWIIFCFHLNPRKKARSRGSPSCRKFTANKVRPPRANGIKVGVMATRAPHRPNPVGLSLAFLEDVMVIQSTCDRKQACVILRGLDLVDGTPVYDIKPYVPWDRICATQFKVPPWVSSADDELVQVNWTPAATEQISKAKEYLAPLYAPTNTGVEEACCAIGEVIAQDPRAIMDGRGECSADSFEFTFGAFRVCFLVDTRIKHAEVTSVVVDSGDLAASKGSYPHNLALRRAAEHEAKESGKKIKWANPVREGITQGLFDLQNGGTYEPRQDSHEKCIKNHNVKSLK
jgi:tRNA-Thr(GGU) m(6)t(6)A37 methyltransferase TsaA